MKNEQFQNNLYYDHNYSIKLFTTIEKYKEIHKTLTLLILARKITYFICYFIGIFKRILPYYYYTKTY